MLIFCTQLTVRFSTLFLQNNKSIYILASLFFFFFLPRSVCYRWEIVDQLRTVFQNIVYLAHNVVVRSNISRWSNSRRAMSVRTGSTIRYVLYPWYILISHPTDERVYTVLLTPPFASAKKPKDYGIFATLVDSSKRRRAAWIIRNAWAELRLRRTHRIEKHECNEPRVSTRQQTGPISRSCRRREATISVSDGALCSGVHAH